MKTIMILPFVLAVAMAGAQTTKQNQIRHVETSLNHLTVLEFDEPVTTIAIADRDSFQVEHHDDKVFVMPLREKVSTNLFVWTASRQVSYELDPAGQLAAMDVLVRTAPAPKQHVNAQASAEPSDAEIRKIASLVLTQAMMGVENVTHDPQKLADGRVVVDVEQVYRAKDRLYIRYSIANRSSAPFRVTNPDVCAPFPSEQPISLVSLRNHQINSQTFAAFRARQVSGISVIQAESGARDLAPGEKTTGVISIGSSTDNPPPSALNARACPLCSVITRAVIASPRPLPPVSRSRADDTR